MAEKFLRMDDVEAATGLGKSTIYRLIKLNEFPKPVKILGKHTSAWLESEVSAWQKSRIAARDVVEAA
jgi:prophage regulatory protein